MNTSKTRQVIGIEFKTQTPTTILTLKSHQTLFDIRDELNVLDYKRSLVVSGTGTGKTYWVAKAFSQKRIIVVPTQALANQIEKEYGAVAFHSDSRNKLKVKDADFIAVTYASLVSLQEVLGPSIFTYLLFLDEAHSVVNNYNYQEKIIKVCAEQVPFYKTIIQLTATPVLNARADFNVDRRFEVKAQDRIIPDVYQLMCQDTTLSVGTMASDLANRNYQVAIFLNKTSEDGQLGRLKTIIENGNNQVTLLNSKKRRTEEFVKVVNEGDAIDSQISICTSILAEGISITKHREKVAIFAMGNWSNTHIIQMCNRFRKASVVEVYIVKSAKSETKDLGEFNIDDFYNVTLSAIPGLQKLFTYKTSLTGGADAEGFNKLADAIGNLGAFSIDGNGNVNMDFLKLSNEIQNINTVRCATDYDLMKASLIEGFARVGMEVNFRDDIFMYDTEISEELREKINENQEAVANSKEQQINEALDKIETETRAENAYKKEGRKNAKGIITDMELKVRRTVDYIATAVDFDYKHDLKKIVEYVRKNDISEANAKELAKRSEALKDLANKNSALHEEYTELFNAFEIGKWYSHDEIREIFEKLNNVKILCGSKRTTQTRTTVINRIFETKEKHKQYNYVKQRGLLIIKRSSSLTID